MLIVFDEAKNSINIAKHGVSLADAKNIEWHTALIWSDHRRDYGEDRCAGLGYIGLRLYAVAFVDRQDTRRIISLRKANRREIQRYAEA